MTVGIDEIARYMRMGSETPSGPLAERMLAVLEMALAAIRPARTLKRFRIDGGSIAAGRLVLPDSGSLSAHLAGCHAAYLICGTLGPRFDALQRTLSAMSGSDALIMQATGAAMIEKWMDSVEDDVRKELEQGESLTSRYSPGYGDFPLEAQRTIIDLLDASRKIGVSVTDSMLMAPSKSVSAIVGVRGPAWRPSRTLRQPLHGGD